MKESDEAYEDWFGKHHLVRMEPIYDNQKRCWDAAIEWVLKGGKFVTPPIVFLYEEKIKHMQKLLAQCESTVKNSIDDCGRPGYYSEDMAELHKEIVKITEP